MCGFWANLWKEYCLLIADFLSLRTITASLRSVFRMLLHITPSSLLITVGRQARVPHACVSAVLFFLGTCAVSIALDFKTIYFALSSCFILSNKKVFCIQILYVRRTPRMHETGFKVAASNWLSQYIPVFSFSSVLISCLNECSLPDPR